jgi:hypothetical protein
MNSPVVYDKAKYHYDGEFPPELPPEQGFVHAGLYLGWIIERDLYSDEFREYAADQILAFRARQRTGPQVYQWCDGALVDDMLNEEGNTFSAFYFNSNPSRFFADYEELLTADLPSVYHVSDTWDNFDVLRRRLDERFAQWQHERRRPWWRMW